jgi:hypothetical protein
VMSDNSVESSPIDRFVELSRLRQLVDDGAVYVPQVLNGSQFATLRALLHRLHPRMGHHLAAHLDAELARTHKDDPQRITLPLVAFDYQLGLDEIDSMARTRTGFAFVDLTPELQDALLGLIATSDLTTRRLDLSRWVSQLHTNIVLLKRD